MLAALVAALMFAPVASALPSLPTTEDDTPGAGQWIVGFHSMPDIKEGDLYLGEPVVSATPELSFITIKPVDFGLFQVKANLDENVRYIETDVSDHQIALTPNDYFTNHAANWGYWKIRADVAHDRTLGSTSIKDGHVDSGLNKGHEEFAGQARVLQGWNFYGGNNNPADERGCNWHGTHTTGTAAATINNGKGFPGIAQSTIIPVKIFGGGACRAASVTNLANALKYVGDQGAQVSSNSWGGGSFSTAINDAITYSRGKGTIFVAAAGNGGCNNCIGNPWKPQEANLIIVTATDVNDAGASFNSKGPESDVSAPGVDIGSSTSGTADYHYMSGTSMATPYVAGVVMLIKTLNPTFTESQVQSRLKSTAVDLGPAGEDDTFGAGRIDAGAAVY